MTSENKGQLIYDVLSSLILQRLQSRRKQGRNQTFIIGVYGPQGSGKTTLSEQIVKQLINTGLRTIAVSQDDFYAPKQERQLRAQNIHPLLATRGVPGTHDLNLAITTFKAVIDGKPFKVPEFDKSIDDQKSQSLWTTIDKPLDVLILEGWCVGLPDILHENLEQHPEPYNSLEKIQDADGLWRRYVAEQNVLYQDWYSMIDFLIGFNVMSFEYVVDWRWQQECDLLLQTGRQFFQSKEEVSSFVDYFERITRVAQEKLPEFADCIIDVDITHNMIIRK